MTITKEAAMPKQTSKKPSDQSDQMTRHIFSLKKAASPEGPSRVEIERRAYELYLSRGGAQGSAVEGWLQAERELQQPHD
jgi:hypothetical protein